MYAIVDIETTGGHAAGHGIIELSIQVFDGQQVVEQFETLVNPFQAIPRYIQAFTGITNEMVSDAPPFEDVAEKVYTCLQGNIFVAHNVNFDYSFIKHHLQQCGYEVRKDKGALFGEGNIYIVYCISSLIVISYHITAASHHMIT